MDDLRRIAYVRPRRGKSDLIPSFWPAKFLQGSQAFSMKFNCHCGALIIDQTDSLPHKAHFIPDQNWFALHDAIDNEVIDALADKRIDRETAYMLMRKIVLKPVRQMWQCFQCGRLYVDDQQHELRCFVPDQKHADHEVLRNRPRPS